MNTNERIKQLNDKIDHWQAKATYYEQLALSRRPFVSYEDYIDLMARKFEG